MYIYIYNVYIYILENCTNYLQVTLFKKKINDIPG